MRYDRYHVIVLGCLQYLPFLWTIFHHYSLPFLQLDSLLLLLHSHTQDNLFIWCFSYILPTTVSSQTVSGIHLPFANNELLKSAFLPNLEQTADRHGYYGCQFKTGINLVIHFDSIDCTRMSTATSKVTLTSSDGVELQLGWSPLPMCLFSQKTNYPGR
jgi:hypothetical protein